MRVSKKVRFYLPLTPYPSPTQAGRGEKTCFCPSPLLCGRGTAHKREQGEGFLNTLMSCPYPEWLLNGLSAGRIFSPYS